MSDPFDLDQLRNADVPAPRKAAKQKAAMAALAAFDQVHLEKTSQPTQGSEAVRRPQRETSPFWSSVMSVLSLNNRRFVLSSASYAPLAGALILPVAVVSGLALYGALDDHAVPPSQPESMVASEVSDGASASSEPSNNTNALRTPKPAPSPNVKGAPTGNERLFGGLAGTTPAGQGASGPLRSYRLSQKRARPSLALRSDRQRRIGVGISQRQSRERNTVFQDGRVLAVAENPVSSFSADVDTAAYARVRRMLLAGTLPSRDVVRIEEMVNYFDYSYPLPEGRDRPFRPSVTIMPTPWNAQGTRLMHIGIKGFDVTPAARPKANLVFLLDVSGSMHGPDRLPLLVSSFRMLLQKLQADDTVSIVTYAGRAGTVLPPTKASDRATILSALDRLIARGGTAGAAGLEQAYRLAEQNFVEGGVNRVMLATDGDFNLGLNSVDELKQTIAKKRDSGIFLSVFGFGRGNTNDALMQALAQNGNGVAAYIDTLAEAQKVMVEQAGGTLFPIASDVKFQVEFNPAAIAEYRLIGYETRALRREDFNNDKVDAGDMGSGHSVTAIYEITPVGSQAVLNDPLRYGTSPANSVNTDEIATLKIRYKLPGGTKSRLMQTVVPRSDLDAAGRTEASADVRFSVAVAAFAQKLRGATALDGFDYEAINRLATGARGADLAGHRSEFSKLVRLAAALQASSVSKPKPKDRP
ncbi:MAG: VWA domain-containing protein [Pseudomonadota bacterium]